MIKDNNFKRTFVKEALRNRNYIGYRVDLLLLKMFISFILFILIYLIYLDLILSILVAALSFTSITLVNKINVDKKCNKGKELLIGRVKREYFLSKIEEINLDGFKMLVKMLFKNEGYNNIIKKGKCLYLAEKEGYITCIKIFKLYDGIEVEKLDIRSLLTFMGQSNIRKCFLISTVNLTEEAKKLLEKFKDKFEIEILDIDGMYNLADKYNILPDDAFYYNRLNSEKNTITKKEVKNNILEPKKVLLYIPASIFFYISSVWMPDNKLVIYVSYYFLILTVINVTYCIVRKYIGR